MIRTSAVSTDLFDTAPNSDTSLLCCRLTRAGLGVILVGLTLAAGLATGCSRSSNASSSTSSSVDTAMSTSSSSTTATTNPETSEWSTEQQDVIASYQAAMTAFDTTLADTPNPDTPELSATTTEPVLTEVRNLAASWVGFGQALKYPDPSVHRIEIERVTVDGDNATLVTCNVDDGIIYEPAIGRVLNDQVTTAQDNATMIRIGGTWKLSTRQQIHKWDGVSGCAGAA